MFVEITDEILASLSPDKYILVLSDGQRDLIHRRDAGYEWDADFYAQNNKPGDLCFHLVHNYRLKRSRNGVNI